jgi:hypothetical protein
MIKTIKDYLDEFDLGHVTHLPNYPRTGNHLRINLSCGITLEKGCDVFYYNQNTASKSNLWYVVHNNNLMFEKGFVNYTSAIYEALKLRVKQISHEHDLVNTQLQLMH